MDFGLEFWSLVFGFGFGFVVFLFSLILFLLRFLSL